MSEVEMGNDVFYSQTGVRPIYLDNHATTPTDPRVAAVTMRCLVETYGNASSGDHVYGDEAEAIVAKAAHEVTSLIRARDYRVVFTSGSTESINLAIQGLARRRRAMKGRRLRIGLMPVEHRAVIDTCEMLSELGEADLTYFIVDTCARLELGDFEEKCRRGLDLICVMAANNEVGTIYPIAEACSLARANGALLLCDATQAAGKIDMEVAEWGPDLVALSAHKLYGPKGCGALLIDRGVLLEPIVHGGGHQWGLRSGTLNVPGIAGLGEACRLRGLEMKTDEPRIASQRDCLQAMLLRAFPDLVVNGDVERRLGGNLHMAIPGVGNGRLLSRLRKRLAVSTGAACSKRIEAPSHVLTAMNLPGAVIDASVRIGLGKFTTDDEVTRAADLIVSTAHEVRDRTG